MMNHCFDCEQKRNQYEIVCIHKRISTSTNTNSSSNINKQNCDAPDCKFPIISSNNYLSIHKMMNEIRTIIFCLPSEILNIIFKQLFLEIYAGCNGLCVQHTLIYDKCIECAFDNMTTCFVCFMVLVPIP